MREVNNFERNGEKKQRSTDKIVEGDSSAKLFLTGGKMKGEEQLTGRTLNDNNSTKRDNQGLVGRGRVESVEAATSAPIKFRQKTQPKENKNKLMLLRPLQFRSSQKDNAVRGFHKHKYTRTRTRT